MVKQIVLLTFGWKRTPEKFVPRGGELITALLKDHDVPNFETVPEACLGALSRLAYARARKEGDQPPRLIHYVRELEKIGGSVEAALRGRKVQDERVHGLLAWHNVHGGSDVR